MATYAIGDIQGCAATFQRLLAQIDFCRSRDHLWLAGDLVNRGPDSLGVLRWALEHDECVTAVLGNHDLHLLAVHLGVLGPRPKDTLNEILSAPDRDALLSWLRCRPLFHQAGDYAMVHAGLLPHWSLEDASARARALELLLRGDEATNLLAAYRKECPAKMDEATTPDDERMVALQAMTRMRIATPDGRMGLRFKSRKQDIPQGYLPWFECPSPRSQAITVLCGHWAALGFHRAAGVVALDSGCVWGGALTAFRLEDSQVFTQPAAE